MASVSLLESVAQHEKTLMDELGRTRDEARRLVDAAHSEVAAEIQEANAALDADIAVLRRDAAKAREDVRASIQKAAADNVENIRRESAGRTAAVREALLARILPNAN